MMNEFPYRDNNHSAVNMSTIKTGSEDTKFKLADCMANLFKSSLSFDADNSENFGAAIEFTANKLKEIIRPNLKAIK